MPSSNNDPYNGFRNDPCDTDLCDVCDGDLWPAEQDYHGICGSCRIVGWSRCRTCGALFNDRIDRGRLTCNPCREKLLAAANLQEDVTPF